MGFDDLLGNKRIKHILTSYLRNDIVPHSMIFTGPQSSNIQGYAMAFAKAVNCLDKNDDFCGTCRNCVEASQEGFLDLRIFHPDGQFYKKEQVLYMVEDNYMKPIKGKRKLYILNDVHRMNLSSANAFLKVLEEPAISNVFLLLTENLEGLLPTIKSRCQILKFSPLPRKEIREYLEREGDTPEIARLKSYLSQSNMESVLSADFNKFMEKRSQ
ncbi:MAG: hypothetical protein GY757_47960, partial [bacterium]|nr:hypothetical protein [bacterium]